MLLELPNVRECAAFALTDDSLGEIVALAASPADGMELSEREIAVACARNLADYQQPRKIFIVDEIPKNAMGKISRVQLGEIFREQIS